MTARTAEMPPRVRARVAGLLYLLVNLPAPFALLYLPSRLIARGDAATTANNILWLLIKGVNAEQWKNRVAESEAFK